MAETTLQTHEAGLCGRVEQHLVDPSFPAPMSSVPGINLDNLWGDSSSSENPPEHMSNGSVACACRQLSSWSLAVWSADAEAPITAK